LQEIFLSKTAGDHFPPRLIPPKQKTVTNNLGKKDFTQPTGRLNMHSQGGSEWGAGGAGYFLFFFLVQSRPVQLAQAKNSDPEVWKRKIHASNG